ncbi:MAG TPA: hypothetical protein PLV68_08355, partial [Ilumatobacteraceae bacterium]|nr:hypothetical protein [Ilumatobacteraceae bacterium]
RSVQADRATDVFALASARFVVVEQQTSGGLPRVGGAIEQVQQHRRGHGEARFQALRWRLLQTRERGVVVVNVALRWRRLGGLALLLGVAAGLGQLVLILGLVVGGEGDDESFGVVSGPPRAACDLVELACGCRCRRTCRAG